MFAASRFKREIERHFGEMLSRRGFFSDDDRVWEGQMRGLGIRMRSQDFRLQLFWDRGTLSVDAAPLFPSGEWFDSDWFNLNQLLSWLRGEDLDSDHRLLASEMDRLYEPLKEFFSREGIESRRKYMEAVVGMAPPEG